MHFIFKYINELATLLNKRILSCALYNCYCICDMRSLTIRCICGTVEIICRLCENKDLHFLEMWDLKFYAYSEQSCHIEKYWKTKSQIMECCKKQERVHSLLASKGCSAQYTHIIIIPSRAHEWNK